MRRRVSLKPCVCQKLRGLASKRVRYLDDVEERNVSLAALDFPHMRPVYACRISQRFLGQAKLPTATLHCGPQECQPPLFVSLT